jgi:hypothetical protein
MRINFFLTEDLSVHSNLDSILFFCSNISVKTAVNSICLRTYYLFYNLDPLNVSRSGCKVINSYFSQAFKVYLKINFQLFLLLVII